MPEVWMPYGDVEVVVDVKAENLGDIVEPSLGKPLEGQISEDLNAVSIRGEPFIVITEASNVIANLLPHLFERIIALGVPNSALNVIASRKDSSLLKKVCEEKGVKLLNASELEKVGLTLSDGSSFEAPKILLQKRPLIFVSEAGFDPLFGFKGGSASLVRFLSAKAIEEAFHRRSGALPLPGSETAAAIYANMVGDYFGETLSVEVLACEEGALRAFVGSLRDAHASATAVLTEACRKTLNDRAKAIVASPGSSFDGATLQSALKASWNLLGGLRDNGTLILLAECSSGLGEEVFRRYASGRFSPDELLSSGEYLPGLEDLIYFREVVKKYSIILVSSLPNYYAESKFGLQTARRASDALNYVLGTQGSKTKFLMIPWASSTILITKAG